MDLDSARKELVQEARDQLEAIENGLLSLEKNGDDAETIKSVFRAAHTLKGSSGIFGLATLVAFTHTVENVLDELRSQRIACDPELIALLLECKDYLSAMVDGLEQGENDPDPEPDQRTKLREKLTHYLPGKGTAKPSIGTPKPSAHPVAKAAKSTTAGNLWHISLRPDPDCLRNGIDPLAILDHLAQLGTEMKVATVITHLPTLQVFDPETQYLGYEISIHSDASQETIDGAFDFIRDRSRLALLPPGSPVSAYRQWAQELGESSESLQPLWLACGSLRPEDFNAPAALPPELPVIATSNEVAPSQAPSPTNAGPSSQPKKHAEHRFVKVEVEKLDLLVDQVGELVIASAAASLAVRQDASTLETIALMQKLIEGVRDASMSLRMVPVGEVFQRFPRLVRDISKELGKKIELVIEGADTELDKSMVDKLIDPLTHMIRNAIDHGIESVEKRLSAGKAETGTVRLNAWHEGSSILIEVSDDGAGIDPARVLAKAQEKGLVKVGQDLSRRDILQLIFEAGFSTAEKVTNLSGRGVGMDVVRRNIEDLRGVVEVDTVGGSGSHFRIRLPLTLAIIDGFQFLAGGSSWVVPLDQVVECTDLSVAETYQGLVRLRDEPLPFFRLRELFGMEGDIPARESLVVVQHGSRHIGIAVDELVGELQAVIKPLGRMFKHLRGIGGTTILGNGQLAMILDIGQLVSLSEEMVRSGQFPALHRHS